MNFVRERMDQLERENALDYYLSSLPCKELVVKYLLHQRILNRKRTKEYLNSSYFSMYTLVEKHLKETKNELEVADSFGYYCDPCKDIQAYLDKCARLNAIGDLNFYK